MKIVKRAGLPQDDEKALKDEVRGLQTSPRLLLMHLLKLAKEHVIKT